MRRAALAIVATVAGLVLLLGFKTRAPAALTTPAAGAAQAPAPATTSAPPATPAPSRSASASTRTVTGDTYDTMYGPVQVRITLSGTRLVDVTPVQLPNSTGRDIEIDDYAVPQLRQEALQAQSANIDMISGASYTSDGYIRSLQSALDRARTS